MKRNLDLEIVTWIGGLGAAAVDHVSEHFGISRSWAYGRLAALVRHGLLEKHRVLAARPALYLATRRGLVWSELSELRSFALAASSFEHAWRIADAAVALAAGLPGWRILSVREILAEERRRGTLVASARVRARSRDGDLGERHRPDLALLSPGGRVAAIEVELSVKRRASLVAICNGWARTRHVAAVYYLTTRATAGPLAWAVQKTRAEDRVTILALEETEEIVRRERAAAKEDADAPR